MKKILVILVISICFKLSANTYYVAPSGGSDSYAGTITQPWATWQKAFLTVNAGDTVFFRGGIWYPSNTYSGNTITQINPRGGLGHNGEPGNPICYFNYPGETPILDCKNVHATGNYLTGIQLYNAHWINWEGLTIRNIYQRVQDVEAKGVEGYPISNMNFENMVVHNIGGCGWYMHSSVGVEGYNFGWGEYTTIPYDTTQYINCDTYQCIDTLRANPDGTPGNMGDGFKHITYPDGYIYYEGCRAWDCSDDGWDIGGRSLRVVKNCWSFSNGAFGRGGSGFKYGGSRDSLTFPPVIIFKCLAANNHGTGFAEIDYPSYVPIHTRVYNNTSYNNGYGYANTGNGLKQWFLGWYRNNISYADSAYDEQIHQTILWPAQIAMYLGEMTESNNTWDYKGDSYKAFRITDTVTVTNDDFVSLDSTQLYRSRQTDSSLPVITYLTLTPESDLINMGTATGWSTFESYPNVGAMVYEGLNPDIGYAEYDETEGVYPTVSTTAATNITSQRARSGGNVTSDGGDTVTERGICYSTSANPTTANSKVIVAGTTGSFTATITGLSSNTTYHVRAYAINGIGTGYGADESFTTREWGIGKSGSVYVVNSDGKIIVIK